MKRAKQLFTTSVQHDLVPFTGIRGQEHAYASQTYILDLTFFLTPASTSYVTHTVTYISSFTDFLKFPPKLEDTGIIYL